LAESGKYGMTARITLQNDSGEDCEGNDTSPEALDSGVAEELNI
jgi:hypothetical protein